MGGAEAPPPQSCEPQYCPYLTTVIDSALIAVAGVDWLSRTLITNDHVPSVDALPLMTPVDAFNERPVGRLPDARLHVYGAVPPVAVSVRV